MPPPPQLRQPNCSNSKTDSSLIAFRSKRWQKLKKLVFTFWLLLFTIELLELNPENEGFFLKNDSIRSIKMAKNNTNRHYSLRKLKTGTASVAVALTVLGAGFANQTEVKANGDGNPREVIEDLAANNPAIQNIRLRHENKDLKARLENAMEVAGRDFKRAEELEKAKQALEDQRKDLETKLKELQQDYDLAKESTSWDRQRLEKELEEKKEALELAIDQASRDYHRATALEKELEEKKKALELAIDQASQDYNRANVLEKELETITREQEINRNLLGNAKLELDQLSSEKEQLTIEKAKLEEEKQISDASRQSLRRDLDASREAKKQVEKDLANLTAELDKVKEDKQISDASRQGLRRDLDASREAKKQVEKDLANLTAELDKVKEEKQISDASRQGLRRDLDASREAKKQVEKALEEANSKLAALEKLNKELEESKKLTEKEKAELQAKLEAEAKALKEQLAKQAEELAKLRAGKASDSQTPDTKPGNKAVPGKGQAPQAGTKPNQNKAPMKETKRQLPSTGETANPFFTAAALTVMATAGVAAVVKRKEEN
ncbi:M protein [Streptococcus pyogenes M1 476]|nr:M protein [Streptococcus pyogenes M1 476]